MGWFDSEANFKQLHNEKIEFEKIERWLEINDDLSACKAPDSFNQED
jgi:hypothetical protein